MDSIVEKRNAIIRDNNHAQEIVENIMSKYSPSTLEIVINKSVDGTVDFAFLEEYGITNLQKIVFSEKGNICSLENCPPTLKHIECRNQLMVDFNFPSAIETIILEGNYIAGTVDLSKYRKLKTLNLNSNRIVSLEKMPESLRNCYLDNNQIRLLDLTDCPNLEILHCVNNNMLSIKGLPAKLVDFQVEKNPIVVIQYRDSIMSGGAGDKSPDERDYNLVEAIDKYFQLQQKYHFSLLTDKKNMLRKAKVEKGKRPPKSVAKELSQIVPKCVGCNRRVATIFSLKNDTYSAVCGDAKTPCPLHIRINRGGFLPIEEIVHENAAALETVKDKIIKNKYDMVFQYVDEKKSVDEFRDIYDEYSLWSMNYKKSLEKYNSLYNNKHEEERYNNQVVTVYELKSKLNELNLEYERAASENKRGVLTQMMHIYKTEFLPELHKLATIKYKTREMNNKYGRSILTGGSGGANEDEMLRMTELRIQDVEEAISAEPGVVKFRMRA